MHLGITYIALEHRFVLDMHFSSPQAILILITYPKHLPLTHLIFSFLVLTIDSCIPILHELTCTIWGSHSIVNEDLCLLGCDSGLTGKWLAVDTAVLMGTS